MQLSEADKEVMSSYRCDEYSIQLCTRRLRNGDSPTGADPGRLQSVCVCGGGGGSRQVLTSKIKSATGVVKKGCIVNSGFVFFVHFSPKLPLLVLT